MGVCHFPVSTRGRNVLIDLLISKSALVQAARVSDVPHSKSSSSGRDMYGYIMVS